MTNLQFLDIQSLAAGLDMDRAQLLALARESAGNSRILSLHELDSESAASLLATLKRVEQRMMATA